MTGDWVERRQHSPAVGLGGVLIGVALALTSCFGPLGWWAYVLGIALIVLSVVVLVRLAAPTRTFIAAGIVAVLGVAAVALPWSLTNSTEVRAGLPTGGLKGNAEVLLVSPGDDESAHPVIVNRGAGRSVTLEQSEHGVNQHYLVTDVGWVLEASRLGYSSDWTIKAYGTDGKRLWAQRFGPQEMRSNPPVVVAAVEDALTLWDCPEDERGGKRECTLRTLDRSGHTRWQKEYDQSAESPTRPARVEYWSAMDVIPSRILMTAPASTKGRAGGLIELRAVDGARSGAGAERVKGPTPPRGGDDVVESDAGDTGSWPSNGPRRVWVTDRRTGDTLWRVAGERLRVVGDAKFTAVVEPHAKSFNPFRPRSEESATGVSRVHYARVGSSKPRDCLIPQDSTLRAVLTEEALLVGDKVIRCR